MRAVKVRMEVEKVLLFGDDDQFRETLASCVRGTLAAEPKMIMGTSAVADFRAMTQCGALILSGSTFSWWSGYLNAAAQIVVHPGIDNNGNWFPTPDSWLKLRGA